MFTLSELKQTRVYQDARQEGELSVVLRQLNCRFGKLSDRQTQSIQNLEITEIDKLADQLLDFRSIDDLDNWCDSQANLALNVQE